jgi:IS4 transposase
VQVQALEKLRFLGSTATGRVFEQPVQLINVENQLRVRRIVLRLNKPTEEGDKSIRLQSNLPKKIASAVHLAESYRERWGVEKWFHRLTVVLNGEVRPLGYPQAALFGFGVALVVSNAFAVVTEALQASFPKVAVREELSMYQVGLELCQAK